MLHFLPIATPQTRVQSDTRQKTDVWSSSRTLRASVGSFRPPRTACVTPSICSTVQHLPEETSIHPEPEMISSILIWIASWSKFRSFLYPQHQFYHIRIEILQYTANWDSFIDVMTRVLTSRLLNHGSILGKEKDIYQFSEMSRPVLITSSLLFNSYRRPFQCQNEEVLR